jgi:hypothetical protein
MTVSSSNNKNTYAGDGTTTSFAFTFSILSESQLLVQIKDVNGVFTTKVITTDFAVTGSGNTSGSTNYTGGNIVFGSGDIPISTDTVVLTRTIPLTQDVDYVENDVFPANTAETALDKLTMINQQQTEELDRTIKIDAAVLGFNATLPTPAADKYLKFNSAADAFELTTLSSGAGIGSLVEDTTPQLGGMLDVNGQSIGDGTRSLVTFTEDGSSVNNINIENQATGSGPTISAVGTDTNVDLNLLPQAAGSVVIDGLKWPQADGSANQVLETDGSAQLSWVANAGSGLASVVDDTTPQLGGDLDVNGNDIVSVSAADINITPDTTGDLVLDGLKWPQADGTAGQILKTDGSAQLSWTSSAASGGKVVQVVNTQTGAVSSGSTQIPSDDTIPQNTEGNEFMTLGITPTNSSNKLKIEVVANVTHNTNYREVGFALFQDTASDAIAGAQAGGDDATTYGSVAGFTHYMTAGTTSATTFKFRAGLSGSGTLVFNGNYSGSRRFGGVMASSITITEIEV